MLRRSLLWLSSARQFSDRLDGLEKEMIELKAFRTAVETTNPEVAKAAKDLIEKHKREVKELIPGRENPLTADEFRDLNQFYAQQKARTFRLGDLQFIKNKNDLNAHANILRREYLVRIAQRARSLTSAPYGLSLMPSVDELKRCYQWSFHDMRNTVAPPKDDPMDTFDRVLRRIFLRHYNVSGLICRGLVELGEREGWKRIDKQIRTNYALLNDFFDDFCYGRAALRFLVGNYMYLSHQILQVKEEDFISFDPDKLTVPIYFEHDPSDFVGQICTKTSLVKITKVAIKDAKASFEDAEIVLRVCGDEDITFLGIPYITYDIISALIDDAIQANIVRQEKYGIPCTDIEVTLSQRKGSTDYVIRVSDTAGGLPLELSDYQLTFWSTFKAAEECALIDEASNNITWTHSPIRLPYAYCAARVIGGDVTIASIEGYGTDRQLYLPAAGIENLCI